MAMSQPPAASSSLPCLVLDYGDEQRTSTMYSVTDGAHRPCDDAVDELLRGKKRSWVTSHGWVLVWDPATLTSYLTREKNKIELPSLAKPPVKAADCVLSSEPTDAGGCTVLLAAKSSNVMWYCRVGDPAAPWSWVRQEYDVGNIHAPADYVGPTKRVMYRPASWRGKFYYQRPGDEIGVLEFSPAAGPVFSVLPMKGVKLVPVGDCMAAASPYLLDLDGELYMVYIFFRNIDFNTVKDVGVYRLDFERKEAVRVDGVGDHAILVGSSRAFAGWCPATTFGLVPNSVYWMSTYDGCLHVYDLEHKTEEVREPCVGVAKPSPTSFWMIPAHT
ncbi:hypothetical protein QYE76_025516 [Lolium multiflorum]|uniref:KIB1-4 beta-propeller domain-containing protein n=1 Tax=Lolium multiflorum TaxID=4521 RepID=A0AAD8VUQ2_LOLMU|nr:hypothetical protein QYE76_025516 [Lolium multiflorum]